jgi:colicin import membrane protein
MRSSYPSDYIFSAMFHGMVVGLFFFLTYLTLHRVKDAPKVFELVQGEGDNYRATEAPALGTSGGVKLTPPTPTPTPAAPVAETAPATPLEAKPAPSTPAPKSPNFVKDVKRIAAKREANIEKRFHEEQERLAKEEAAKAKRLTKEEFDKLNKGKISPSTSATVPKVARIDTVGIAKGVESGSTDNKEGGANGKVLNREQADALDDYYSMLKQRLKTAFEPPPGLSDNLVAYVRVQSGSDGSLSGARITKSSGSAEFDAAVLSAISRTRMPSRPDGKNESVTFPFTMKEKDEG